MSDTAPKDLKATLAKLAAQEEVKPKPDANDRSVDELIEHMKQIAAKYKQPFKR